MLRTAWVWPWFLREFVISAINVKNCAFLRKNTPKSLQLKG